MLPLFCLLPTVYCLLLFLAATHGEGYNDQASPVQQTRDVGHIIVAGGTALPTPNDPDFLVLEPGPDGGVDWQKLYGKSHIDIVSIVQQTSDGGYIVHGAPRSFGAGKEDLWVLKLKADGTIEWQKTYGGNCDDRGDILLQTHDGGYIVAGGTFSFGAGEYDVWVLKLRPDGTVEWEKTYGGDSSDRVFSIRQTIDGGYIVAGDTCSFGAGKFDAWVLKLRPDGTIEWQKTYGGNSFDRGSFIRQTSDGGYILAGSTASFSSDRVFDIWALKLRADGTIEWQKTYGGDFFDWVFSIRQTSDSGYIVSGLTESFGAGKDDLWVLKLKADGTIEWQKTYGGSSDDGGNILQQTNDGGYIVAGYTYTKSFGARKEDLWVLKLKADGTIEWQKTYRGNHDDRDSISLQTHDGGYIVSGWTKSFGAGKKDLWVLRLRPDGSFGYAQDQSIDPACESVKETTLSVKDSNATVKDTTVSPIDSNANPQDSSAIVQDTNAPVDLFCLPTTVKP